MKHFISVDSKYLYDSIKKHPKFADEFTELTLDDVQKVLSQTRHFNDESAVSYASMILREEMYEALEAFLEGRYSDCDLELQQCHAVIFRMQVMNAVLSRKAELEKEGIDTGRDFVDTMSEAVERSVFEVDDD